MASKPTQLVVIDWGSIPYFDPDHSEIWRAFFQEAKKANSNVKFVFVGWKKPSPVFLSMLMDYFSDLFKITSEIAFKIPFRKDVLAGTDSNRNEHRTLVLWKLLAGKDEFTFFQCYWYVGEGVVKGEFVQPVGKESCLFLLSSSRISISVKNLCDHLLDKEGLSVKPESSVILHGLKAEEFSKHFAGIDMHSIQLGDDLSNGLENVQTWLAPNRPSVESPAIASQGGAQSGDDTTHHVGAASAVGDVNSVVALPSRAESPARMRRGPRLSSSDNSLEDPDSSAEIRIDVSSKPNKNAIVSATTTQGFFCKAPLPSMSTVVTALSFSLAMMLKYYEAPDWLSYGLCVTALGFVGGRVLDINFSDTGIARTVCCRNV